MIRFIQIAFYVSLLVSSQCLFGQTAVIPDDNFKACLISKAPSAFNSNGELILTEAANVTGNLSCIGDTISSIEGLEHFTSLKEVNLSRNSISHIDAFPVNDSLTRLVLDDNMLSTLPDLSVLKNLKTLTVRRNQLTSLPDLNSNINLTQLYINNNLLTNIPALQNHPRLWAINVSNNQLTQLPSLDALQALEELVARNNQLTQIPNLTTLDSLKVIDLKGNSLASVPPFPSSYKLQSINIENNVIITLPDFSMLSDLQYANLNGNYLTFENLLPLTAITNYQSIFTLTYQQSILVGQAYEIRRLQEHHIQTGIDTSLTNINYEWFFDNSSLQSSTSDSLLVFSDKTSDTGFYRCQLSHPSFPNLVLETNSFHVTVKPCFDIENIGLDVSPRTCKNNGGSVTVTSSNPSLSYQLVSTSSTEEFFSSDGSFYDLGETNYALYGQLDNCRETISTNILVGEEDCDNVYISIDGDGHNDVYYINETGSASIFDKFGNSLGNIQLPGYWDGYYQGQKVAPGLYYIDINQQEKVIKLTVVH